MELLTAAPWRWRGPVAAAIVPQARARAACGAAERGHMAAREAADAALPAGVPDAVLPELRKAADHPLDEPLPARLVLAPAATGRRSEARETYEAAVQGPAPRTGRAARRGVNVNGRSGPDAGSCVAGFGRGCFLLFPPPFLLV
ncbi:BTAD domain-containing putative transcriptional regulator [Streptomyces sp. NPDC001848]|uniref:BTAD domain-containing putative transcriptional regulator n=1 Tax=Streptomyces sp. NPDC001848 TaxID=3364618 RepID=UPI0036C2E2EC